MNRPLFGWFLAALLLAQLVVAWGEFFAPISRTTFGIQIAPHGNNAIVTSVTPGLSAAHAGVGAGDVIILSALSLSDRLRVTTVRSPVGYKLAVPIEHNGVRHTVTLESASQEGTGDPPGFIGAALYTATVTLLIIAFIAIRRPSLPIAALTLYGMGSVQVTPTLAEFSWLPDPWFGAVAATFVALFGTVPLMALVPFITRFPDEPKSANGIIRMRVGDILFFAVTAVCIVQAIYEPMVYFTWTAYDVWSQIIIVAIVACFTAFAYHDESGETRRRIGWVLIGVLVTAIGYAWFDVVSAFAGPEFSHVSAAALSLVLSTALPIALAYAILRHRVLDIGFALNRTLVYGAMTAMVVAVVSLVDFLAGRLMREERLAVVVEALIAIGFGFGIQWIHAHTERLIDRIVFRARHLAEKRIEYRIGALAFATSSASIDEALSVEAAHILDLASAAVFRYENETGPFERRTCIGWDNAALTGIDSDALLVRTLRSLERPFVLDDVGISVESAPSGAARPVFAVPLSAQHALIGFVLYGERQDGALPDPEERALLTRLCASASTAYVTAETHQLRERAAFLERSLAAFTPAQTR